MAITTIAQIRPTQILIYCKSDKKRTITEESKANLLQNRADENKKYNGEISKAAQRKVRRIVENWSYGIEERAAKARKKDNFNRKLTFITLTLSAQQKHTDKEIKRLFLDSFLVKIQRDFGVKNYVWKAELQQNGNIHFHIIADSYIHHTKIKSIWNRIQEKGGYISSVEQKYGHKEPNSTDVKSVKSSKIVSYYISKYITKKDKEIEGRKIEGSVWGCSDNLKNLKYYEKEINYSYYENHEKYNNTDTEFFAILNEMRKMDEDNRQIEINEFTEIHLFKRNALELYKCWSVEENIKITDFYNSQTELLYN